MSGPLSGQGVVVTGAGHGIGRALATRMAAGGARVVVNDLDAGAATQVAAATGGYAAPGDAASEQGVAALVAATREHLGEIDIWFANAGIDRGRGLDASEADWAAAIEVNVLGSPAYAVTKHGAVAFAEWLSATCRHRGVVVQAICPQGVRTRMLEDAGPLQELLSRDVALEPEDIAEAMWQALRDDRFLVLPHPEVAEYYRLRAADPDRWLAGMNKLQRSLEALPY